MYMGLQKVRGQMKQVFNFVLFSDNSLRCMYLSQKTSRDNKMDQNHSFMGDTYLYFIIEALQVQRLFLVSPSTPSSAWMRLTELCLFTPIWFSTVHAQVSLNINFFYQGLQCAEWLVKRVYCKRQMKMRVQGQVAVEIFFFF